MTSTVRSAVVLAQPLGNGWGSLLALALALGSCTTRSEPAPAPSAVAEATPSAQRGPLVPLAQKQFGAPLTETETTPLDALLRDSGKFAKKTIRTEGVVSAVCKSMGCWMELGDDSGLVHVRMAGHAFFVPKNASGHRAAVQGIVLPPSNSECTEEAKAQTGKTAKVELEATGVSFID